MSSQKTTHLKLHRWIKSDPIKMAEFNENFQKLDEAIAAGAKIATGSYVGTGTYGSSNPCSLTFDFPPRLFIMFKETGIRMYVTVDSSSNHMDYIFTLDGLGVTYSPLYTNGGGGTLYAKKSQDGKTLFYYGNYSNHQCNGKGETFRYIAIG